MDASKRHFNGTICLSLILSQALINQKIKIKSLQLKT